MTSRQASHEYFNIHDLRQKKASISDGLRKIATELKLHEVLRFKDRMTPAQMERLQKKITTSRDAVLLYSQGIELIPEVLELAALGLFWQNNDTSLLDKMEDYQLYDLQEGKALDQYSYAQQDLINYLVKRKISVNPKLLVPHVIDKAYRNDTSILTDPELKQAVWMKPKKYWTGDTAGHILAKQDKVKVLECPEAWTVQNDAGEVAGHILARKGFVKVLNHPEAWTVKVPKSLKGLEWVAGHFLAQFAPEHAKEILKYPQAWTVKDIYGDTAGHILASKGEEEVLKHPESKKVLNNKKETAWDILKYVNYKKHLKSLEPK